MTEKVFMNGNQSVLNRFSTSGLIPFCDLQQLSTDASLVIFACNFNKGQKFAIPQLIWLCKLDGQKLKLSFGNLFFLGISTPEIY